MYEDIKKFIENFSDIPGRLPTFKHYRVMLLPSDMTKNAVYRFYEKALNQRLYAEDSENIWHDLCPYVAVMKPATDLCFTCQKNASLLMKSANLQDSVKKQQLEEAQEHVKLAKLQRECYNEQCSQAASKLKESPANTPDVVHYSFDFAQQIHYPFDPHNLVHYFSKLLGNVGYLVCAVRLSLVMSTI